MLSKKDEEEGRGFRNWLTVWEKRWSGSDTEGEGCGKVGMVWSGTGERGLCGVGRERVFMRGLSR